MCEPGYSPRSANDSTCVRNCAIGPDISNPLFYENGGVCWPYCLQADGSAFGIDTGSTCTKLVSNRTGSVAVSQCPPNYTGYDVYSGANSNDITLRSVVYERGFESSADTSLNGGIQMQMCYKNCPPVCTDANMSDPPGCTSVQLFQTSWGECRLDCDAYVPVTGGVVPSTSKNCQTSHCWANEGEYALANSLSNIYPSVSSLYNPGTAYDANFQSGGLTVYGNLTNFSTTETSAQVVSELPYGTCIRDPYSYLAESRRVWQNSGDVPVGETPPANYPYYPVEYTNTFHENNQVQPTKIIRDFVYPTCQNGQEFSFYSDSGPLITGNDPLTQVTSSYTVNGFNNDFALNGRTLVGIQPTESASNGYLPEPSYFVGSSTSGKNANFQRVFNCQDICTTNGIPNGYFREDNNCMQPLGNHAPVVYSGRTYKDYSLREWAITFDGSESNYASLIYPTADQPNRRVLSGLSGPSNGPTLGFDTSTILTFSGSMPTGMFPGQTTCPTSLVPALPWVMTSSPQMYEKSTTPNSNFGGTASLSACFDPAVCSPANGGTVGSNPIGYIINGNGSGTVQVFCATYGSNGYKDHCTSRGMTDDVYTNLCLRSAVYQNPNTRYPNVCPVIPDLNYRNNRTLFENFPNKTRTSVLYGQSSKTADLTNPSFPGYKGEKIIEGQDYQVSPCVGVFDPARSYNFNDVVASYSTNLLGSVGKNTVLTGPFFRNIKNILAGSGVAPPSAPNTNLQYSDPATEGPLSNTFWTNANIPSRWENYFQRFAGYKGNLNHLCVTSDGTPTGIQLFCPPVCVTQCPLGDPNTQVGLYEPGYMSSYISGNTVVQESNCWPRCGPSDVFEGSGEQCTLRAFSTDNQPAYKQCANATLPVVQLNDGNIHSGHSFNTPDQSPSGPRFLSVRTGTCYDQCPANNEISPFKQPTGTFPSISYPQDNFTTCVDTCPESESFYDGANSCYKIAALRQPYTSSTVVSNIQTVLTNNLSTSSKFSKFSLSGGLQNLLTVIGIIIAIGVFTGLLLVLKNRHTVKTQEYFFATLK